MKKERGERMLDSVLPDQELIDLVIQHRGEVTQEALQAAGYSQTEIRQLCREQVLVPRGAGYTLENLTAFVDGLVLVQWAVPTGIIGKVSALVQHEISVALAHTIDLCVPADWQGTFPADLGIRPFVLEPDLREYGVVTVYPTPPGTVPITMYAPAVALAQAWADPTISEETKEDGLLMYQAFLEDARALQEAFDRYGLRMPGAVQSAR